MKKLNIYPSYTNSQEEALNKGIIIEHTLKYADIDQIQEIVKKYGLDECKNIWIKTLLPDTRMEKLNYFLAKFIFKISFDDSEIEKYFEQNRKTRLERINEILNG